MRPAVLDRFAAAAGLLVLSPLLLAVAAAIVVASGLPVFFRQARVGRRGVVFSLLKFRSMKTAAAGAGITGAGDARVTPMGRFLRKYKLDELPQLWNVLVGDMSLVGPRPEVPKFVDSNNPAWRAVLSVRPGITDLASLLYRNEEEMLVGVADVEDYYRRVILPVKLALNIEYQSARTLWTDLKLVAFTIWYSVFPSEPDPRRIRRALFSQETS